MSTTRNHAVEVIGNGDKVLVMAHGYGCDKNMWRGVTTQLQDHYRIVLYDLMGCGGSAIALYDRQKYATLNGHADDLIALLDELDLRDVTLIGHSVSAMTAALVSNKRPDLVDKMIMVCPSPSFINDAPYEGGFERSDILALLDTLDANYLGWSSEMAPAIMGTPDMPDMGEKLTNSFCQADPEIARHFAHVTFLSDHRKDVAKVTKPTLVLQCRDDVIVPSSVGQWMISQMPDAQLVVLDAMGHCPHISYPHETTAAIQSYLNTP